MDGWRVAHLIFLGLWGGIVLAELVLEASPKNEADHRFVAKVHYFTDLFVELPVLGAVLLTGVMLLRRVGEHTTLHWVKLGLALAAIATNVWAAVTVFRRKRATDPAELMRLTTQVRWSGIGVPFGLAALYIGLTRFHH
ncbi:MAG TPA: hypothetical protein VL172_09300 [Kofleriaceae bacterium]|jgi:uncharacterized membrane protein|nr:hypothetical protein [Kofleriaceae bacterium]